MCGASEDRKLLEKEMAALSAASDTNSVLYEKPAQAPVKDEAHYPGINDAGHASVTPAIQNMYINVADRRATVSYQKPQNPGDWLKIMPNQTGEFS